jgi:Cft2 family RNA processing exonuclease
VKVIFDRGIYLPDLDLWLDSGRRKESGFISHAHSDHTARHQRPVITPNTHLLLAEFLKRSDPVILEYHETLETERYSLTLYPAGHCLGSAQALVESKATGQRLLYTGDFKSRASPVNEPLEPVCCDVLVMEATFGRPQYAFPDQDQVIATAVKTLRQWLSHGARPAVQVWRLGKSQEMLHYLLAEGFDVAMEETCYRAAEVYQEAGIEFPGNFSCWNGQWPEGRVVICPPGRRSTSLLDQYRGKRVMELTGWAMGRHTWGRRADASLPYSDHADFNELVSYVRQVQPQQVYTVNGFPDLAAHLRAQGYPAVHLDGNPQPIGGEHQLKLM